VPASSRDDGPLLWKVIKRKRNGTGFCPDFRDQEKRRGEKKKKRKRKGSGHQPVDVTN